MDNLFEVFHLLCVLAVFRAALEVKIYYYCSYYFTNKDHANIHVDFRFIAHYGWR